MLKIRLQGTLKDIQWFRRILEKHKELDVLEVSDAYTGEISPYMGCKTKKLPIYAKDNSFLCC